MASIDQLKKYEELFAKSQAYNPAQFQQGFEKDYGEATNYNKDLIDQRANVVGQMQSLPAELRAKYAQGAIRNPLEQEALIAQRRGTQTADLNRLTDFLGARGSRYEDVLGNYLQAYIADQQMAERAAENQWRLYQDVVQQDQFNRQLSKDTGGGASSSYMDAVIQAILDKEGDTQRVNPQQQVLEAISRIKNMRKTQNIENKMNQYHKEIMNQARSLGLNISSEALWQQLGNTPKTPQTLRLFL